jgi:xanthine dehydrogenase YagS FAD-binding subunit
VRLALGGVGTIPWRAREAENILIGRPPSEDLFATAAEAALSEAMPLPQNAFKVPLCQRAIQRTLVRVCGAEDAD